jgi:uroporphyrinogen decarboxylase
MQSRELIHNLLTNTGHWDRVGLYEHFWVETPHVWMAQGYPAQAVAGNVPETPRREVTVSHVMPSFVGENQARQPISPYHYFEYDMHPVGGLFDVEPISGYEEILEQTDEWVVKRNGAGAVFRYWKHKSGTPEHIDFTLTSREIWERDYRPYLLELNPARLERGGLRLSSLAQDRAEFEWGREHCKWCQYGHICIWETMRGSMGDLCMYESLLLDPGWIHDFNRVYTDFFKAHFDLLFETVGLPDGIWLYEDLAYRNGLFASPDVLRRLFLPYFAELVESFHARGLPVVLHSCGNVTQAVPLAIEAGFDALQPLEIKAGCDPFALAEQYGDRLAFIGGLDVRFLESNDRAVIEREVTRLIEGMKARGARYIFHSDHSITPRVTYDSYRYALDVYRKHMRY